MFLHRRHAVAVNEGTFVGVGVRVEIHKEHNPAAVVIYQGLNGKDRGLLVRLSCAVKPIEIVAHSVHSIGPVKNTIRVEDRYYQKNKVFEEQIAFLGLRK